VLLKRFFYKDFVVYGEVIFRKLEHMENEATLEILKADLDAMKTEIRALHLALTYGLQTEDMRNRVMCHLAWCQEYARVTPGFLTREDTLGSPQIGVLRTEASFFGVVPRRSVTEALLGFAVGRWDIHTTATLVRSIEGHGITWTDLCSSLE
jgi:hypothetical protein